MHWKEHYQSRIIDAEEAARMIKSGDKVAVGHACGSPEILLDAMVARAAELENVEISHMVAMGKAEYCQPQYARSFRHNAIFVGATSRQAVAEGRADYTPRFFVEIPSLFTEGPLCPDVALITVSPPDKQGYVSLGISVDYTKDAARVAKLTIAEVNPNMPRTGGDAYLPVSEIDYFVPTDRPMLEIQPPTIGEVEKAIGSHVASLIKDGDCLQLGIGAIPDAVLTFLGEKNDLGIHSEMISDGVMGLVEAGVVTCRRKNFHPHKIVLTFAMGTAKFYEWLSDNSMIEMYPATFTNDPFVIAQNDNMVSVNSAISVDLMGQVAADAMGTKQFSGVGGQVDFVRGAARSKGGRSIIAMPATAAKGKVSRIVAGLERGQAVTTSRNDVDYIVTEFGVAHLKGRTLRERAEALIGICAPAFREGLREEYRELYGR
ncbi:MAG: hypothetical protein LDL07_14125 [Desulfarculus sp.]|nr:hypothetical protein [Desulfarculus sp.]